MKYIQQNLSFRVPPEKSSSGFTLIELLVVIAIIGILSSVVLASLNTARGKGANAAVKANLANLRAQMEIYYDTTGNASYGTTGASGINCVGANPATIFGNTKIQQALVAAQNAGGGTARCAALPASGGATTYVVSVQLKVTESGFNYWCVDNSGASKGSAITFNVGAAQTTCP